MSKEPVYQSAPDKEMTKNEANPTSQIIEEEESPGGG